MSTPDDREEFRQEGMEYGRRMEADTDLRGLDHQIIARSDQHHYSYVWTWLGIPIIQMPSDIVAMQEIIWQTRPEVIVETGFARGGSAILYSSILEAIGSGSVIAVDIEFRAHNRQAVIEHPLGRRVQFIEGSSTDPRTLDAVRAALGDSERIMVVLDSDHSHSHVLNELRLYSPLVTDGQYLVVADTVIEHLPVQKHRPRSWGPGNSPQSALDEWLGETAGQWERTSTNDKLLMSSSRGGYLRRNGGT